MQSSLSSVPDGQLSSPNTSKASEMTATAIASIIAYVMSFISVLIGSLHNLPSSKIHLNNPSLCKQVLGYFHLLILF